MAYLVEYTHYHVQGLCLSWKHLLQETMNIGVVVWCLPFSLSTSLSPLLLKLATGSSGVMQTLNSSNNIVREKREGESEPHK